MATLQGEKLFVVVGDFGHCDHTQAADEMAAGPVETGHTFKCVIANGTFAFDARLSVGESSGENHWMILYLTGSRAFDLWQGFLLFSPESPKSD